MTTFAATYARKSAPASHAWYSVETPNVFLEFKLPVLDRHMTTAQRKQYRSLLRLAEKHGTHVRESQVRRG